MREPKNIIVIGSGFAGITALIALWRLLRRRKHLGRYILILVSKTPYHLYTPALYEMAAIPRDEAGAFVLKNAIAIPLERILKHLPGVRFVGGTVSALDPRNRRIMLDGGGTLDFEYLVIAMGSETNFFGIPGLEEHSTPIKKFDDAIRLRNRIQTLADAGEPFRIMVGGGGATGVEVAAELAKYLHCLDEKKPCRASITLLEAGPEILSGFQPSIVASAKKRLKKLGIEVTAGAPIREVKDRKLVLADNRTLPFDILVWSGGVRPPKVVEKFGLALDSRGGIAVKSDLEAAPGIYAAGDCAGFVHPETKRPLPWNVPVAEAEARLAARNIVADIEKTPRRNFEPLRAYPFILAVGGKFALTDLVLVKFFGFLGWILKQIVELRYLFFVLSPKHAIGMWLRTVYYSTKND